MFPRHTTSLMLTVGSILMTMVKKPITLSKQSYFPNQMKQIHCTRIHLFLGVPICRSVLDLKRGNNGIREKSELIYDYIYLATHAVS